MQTDPAAGKAKSNVPWGKVIFFGCGTLLLLAGLVVAVAFYGIRRALKSSEAYQTAVVALKQSSEASQALGEIEDTGVPSGSVSTDSGGSGSASLSISVTGSKMSGEYYATLEREKGQWYLVSGRVALDDGGSVNIRTVLTTGVSIGGGKQLALATVDTSSWRDSEWTQQNIRFRLPPEWITKKMTQRELDFRAGEEYSSTHLIGHSWIWDRELPAQSLFNADLQSAAEKLRNGVILGYAERHLGGTPGVLTISSVGESVSVSWRAIVSVGGSQRSIDLLLGARDRDFEGLEPTFNTILESVRFE